MLFAFRKSVFLVSSIGVLFIGQCQTSNQPVLMPVCPECTLAAQTPDRNPLGPPQVEFLQDPKPYDWQELSKQIGRTMDIRMELTGRIVSTRPLVLDVLEVAPIEKEILNLCGGVYVIALVDAKLRGVLSQLRFNQVVKATLFYGGNREFPHEMVLSDLALNAHVNSGPGSCFNRSGLLVSYRGSAEYVKVYNDGSIFYQDSLFNQFRTQKLSGDELARLLKAFADNSFDTVPSSPPPMEPVFNENSLTLICSRLQNVPLAGLETKLVPLLRRIEDLRVRATSQSFYLLLTNGRKKLTILEWPFREVPLNQLERPDLAYITVPETLRHSLPEDFLSRLPLTYSSLPTADDPNRYVYCTDEGKMYRLTRAPCGNGRPHCNTFQDLTAIPVRQPATTLSNPSPDAWSYSWPALLWPSDLGIDMTQIGPEGRRITNEDYEKRQPFYLKLYENGASGIGYSFIDGGYIYEGVRICRVDPQAPPTRCTNPDAKAY
jgi:hypothetical protein